MWYLAAWLPHTPAAAVIVMEVRGSAHCHLPGTATGRQGLWQGSAQASHPIRPCWLLAPGWRLPADSRSHSRVAGDTAKDVDASKCLANNGVGVPPAAGHSGFAPLLSQNLRAVFASCSLTDLLRL